MLTGDAARATAPSLASARRCRSSRRVIRSLHGGAQSDPARKRYELIPARLADAERPMPPSSATPLTASDAALLSSWASSGAPAGTEACRSPPDRPTVPPLSCTPDLTIGPAVPHALSFAAGDEYVCYGVDVTRPEPTHVTALSARIDNVNVVHHVVLFEADTPYSTTPSPCTVGGALSWRMVMAWAPGGKGLELPVEAGFPLGTGGAATHYIVQIHYSNPLALANQTDRSGFDLCTASPRSHEADVLAFGTQSIDIPARAVGYEKVCSVTVPVELSGLHFIASMPHMHKLGASISTTLFAGGDTGQPFDLGTVSTWDFNAQPWTAIDRNVVTKTKDVITTRCAWNNTTGVPVRFGEKTADEMCYSFTVYYPKIRSPRWSWALPTTLAKCR